MKLMKTIISAIVVACGLFSAHADNCELRISVAPITSGDDVPAAIESKLESKLISMLTRSGIVGEADYGQFFLTGRFDKDYIDKTSGPGGQFLVKTDLTLYIGDYKNQQVYASVTIPLKGVGDSEERAYVKCLSALTAANEKWKGFIDAGKQKIIDYYDSNYKTYLQAASTAMSMRNYDEALYHASSVPECSRGYEEAKSLSLSIYNHYTDYEAAQLLSKAEAEWAASPDQAGAARAFSYLNQIDPASASAAGAKALGAKISKATQKQWEFENIQKYKDAHEREKLRINAARDVAVAYAKSRPKTVYHFHWLY